MPTPSPSPSAASWGKAWKMSWNGSGGILPPRTGMKWRSSIPMRQAPYTMPTFLSPSTARQRIRNLRISPLRTWRLSCAVGNPTFTPISGPRRSVKRRWRTRKPGKRPPYPKNGWSIPFPITGKIILPTRYSSSRKNRGSFPPITHRT